MADIPLAETSTVVTTGPFVLSTEGSGCLGETGAEFGSNGTDALGVSCVGSTITAAVDATSGDPMGILIIFHDATPYSRTENQASHFYQQLHRQEKQSEFPVIICDGKESADAMEAVFGACNREKMVDTLMVLEKLIDQTGNDKKRN